LRPQANSEHEIRNPKQIQKHKGLNAPERNTAAFSFDHLNLNYWVLPFDLAQGGESVEPFRASPASPKRLREGGCFEFRILLRVA
jgi:hypothetical protein